MKTKTSPVEITIKTNDPELLEGGAPAEVTTPCNGYMLFAFSDEGAHFALHGKVNVAAVSHALIRDLPRAALRRLLERMALDSLFMEAEDEAD